MINDMNKIYDKEFVENLFDNMSSSYAKMNHITSFGFSERWRRKFINELEIKENSLVIDLMTGMGECWPFVFQTSQNVELIGIDFSKEMLNFANSNRKNFIDKKIKLIKENVLENSIKANSADYVISGFGLKTFNDEQLNKLALEIKRILKPNGRFSLIDVSVPNSYLLQVLYMFYLKKIIPQLGKLFLGNPDTYKMLGIYTEKYKNSKVAAQIFINHGLEVSYLEYFYGCASGIKGVKH